MQWAITYSSQCVGMCVPVREAQLLQDRQELDAIGEVHVVRAVCQGGKLADFPEL